MTPVEAERAARARVGNVLSVREDVRASGWEHALDTFTADVRYGLRHLISKRDLGRSGPELLAEV